MSEKLGVPCETDVAPALSPAFAPTFCELFAFAPSGPFVLASAPPPPLAPELAAPLAHPHSPVSATDPAAVPASFRNVLRLNFMTAPSCSCFSAPRRMLGESLWVAFACRSRGKRNSFLNFNLGLSQ